MCIQTVSMMHCTAKTTLYLHRLKPQKKGQIKKRQIGYEQGNRERAIISHHLSHLSVLCSASIFCHHYHCENHLSHEYPHFNLHYLNPLTALSHRTLYCLLSEQLYPWLLVSVEMTGVIKPKHITNISSDSHSYRKSPPPNVRRVRRGSESVAILSSVLDMGQNGSHALFLYYIKSLSDVTFHFVSLG